MPKHFRGTRPKYTGPKRLVRRVRAYIDNNLTNTQGNVTIFTVPEDMTLVRMRVQGSILYQVEGTAQQTAEFQVAIWKRGIQISEPLVSSLADKVDDDVPDEFLFSRIFQALNNVADNDIIREFDLSNKAMRKLSKSDLIVVSHICSSAVAWRLTLIAEVWLKLA